MNPADSARNLGVFFDSGLDYCNSLLHQIPAKDLQKLQRVQNCLARVVTKAPRFSRSIPLLNYYIGFQSSLEYNSKYALLYFVVSMMVSHLIYLAFFFLQTP